MILPLHSVSAPSALPGHPGSASVQSRSRGRFKAIATRSLPLPHRSLEAGNALSLDHMVATSVSGHPGVTRYGTLRTDHPLMSTVSPIPTLNDPLLTGCHGGLGVLEVV